jgi:hypothetical protein
MWQLHYKITDLLQLYKTHEFLNELPFLQPNVTHGHKTNSHSQVNWRRNRRMEPLRENTVILMCKAISTRIDRDLSFCCGTWSLTSCCILGYFKALTQTQRQSSHAQSPWPFPGSSQINAEWLYLKPVCHRYVSIQHNKGSFQHI